jgi:hypothetical protein
MLPLTFKFFKNKSGKARFLKIGHIAKNGRKLGEKVGGEKNSV